MYYKARGICGSVVGVVTRLCAKQFGIQISDGASDFSFLQKLPHWFQGPSNILSSGYQGSFPGLQTESIWDLKLIPHLLVVSRLRMNGAIPPPPLCLHVMDKNNFMKIGKTRDSS